MRGAPAGSVPGGPAGGPRGAGGAGRAGEGARPSPSPVLASGSRATPSLLRRNPR